MRHIEYTNHDMKTQQDWYTYLPDLSNKSRQTSIKISMRSLVFPYFIDFIAVKVNDNYALNGSFIVNNENLLVISNSQGL